jgi:ubiquitin carboxyl-terminal hydrolase 10
LSAESVELPVIAQGTTPEPESAPEVEQQPAVEVDIPRPETPLTSQPTSENAESTNPTTPSSIQQQSIPAGGDTTPVAPKQPQKSTAQVVPAVPKTIPREAPKPASEDKVEAPQKTEVEGGEGIAKAADEKGPSDEAKEVTAPKAWTTPKLWTGLFNPAGATSTAASSESGRAATTPGFSKTNSESLAEALRSFIAVSPDSKVAFLEPRGLVNTGNMCYMNSVGSPSFFV